MSIHNVNIKKTKGEKTMKKITLLMALALIMAVSGCGKDKTEDTLGTDTAVQEEIATPSPEVEETPEVIGDPTAEPTKTPEKEATKAPTKAPTTKAPTTKAPTQAPTWAPVTTANAGESEY